VVGDDEVPVANELAEQLKLAGDGGIRPLGEKRVGVLKARHSILLPLGVERVANTLRQLLGKLAVFVEIRIEDRDLEAARSFVREQPTYELGQVIELKPIRFEGIDGGHDRGIERVHVTVDRKAVQVVSSRRTVRGETRTPSFSSSPAIRG
jgi:hypothetical protein